MIIKYKQSYLFLASSHFQNSPVAQKFSLPFVRSQDVIEDISFEQKERALCISCLVDPTLASPSARKFEQYWLPTHTENIALKTIQVSPDLHGEVLNTCTANKWHAVE